MKDQSSAANARSLISKELLKKTNNSKNVEFRIMLDSNSSGEEEERDRDLQHLDGKFKKKKEQKSMR
ncbi:hypothetical protein [Algibacter sp. 2305UL17-15]|uniref:hypothetical protein n=1 Tax=Algibacter sp. 2305UL17-15 TaxID=3231268 RepID=UPI00345A6D18